jgi:hypothetical protein
MPIRTPNYIDRDGQECYKRYKWYRDKVEVQADVFQKQLHMRNGQQLAIQKIMP